MAEESGGGGIGVTLTKKAGPLPVWIWAGLGVAVLAFILIRRQKAAAAATAAAAAANTVGGTAATNLGSNTLSNLVPQAYPMPFQMGDVFVNTTTSGAEAPPAPTPAPPPVKNLPTAYVTKKGDTWATIGKALNIAPVALWEVNGAPAGFKMPAVGTQINLRGVAGVPEFSYANQDKLVSGQQDAGKAGYKPTPGTVLR